VTELVVVHPASGEVLENLDTLPAEVLADAYTAIRQEQQRLEDMRRAVKAELQTRLATRGVARMVAGDYEIGETTGWRSVWDGEELERVVGDLLEAGAITLRDVGGLIRHEAKVNGNVANALSRRLVGQNKALVEDCRTREPERRAFDVVPSLPLIADR
jgi:hypothetical protein